MAAHYQTAVLPARPYKPKDKAKAEVAVQVVERWILEPNQGHPSYYPVIIFCNWSTLNMSF
jgi:transposase